MNSAWVTERFALTALDYPIPQRANRLDFMLGALTPLGAERFAQMRTRRSSALGSPRRRFSVWA